MQTRLEYLINDIIDSYMVSEADRHRSGYYEEYAERTGKKNRHRPGYYAERYSKSKIDIDDETLDGDIPVTIKKKSKKKDRHRPGYYRDYNLAHPERLNRGFTKGCPNGCIDDLPRKPKRDVNGNTILDYDMMDRPITTDRFADKLRNKEDYWHDDDWEEDDDLDDIYWGEDDY